MLELKLYIYQLFYQGVTNYSCLDTVFKTFLLYSTDFVIEYFLKLIIILIRQLKEGILIKVIKLIHFLRQFRVGNSI